MSHITRNLRDGELVIRDGGDPALSLTVLLDEGDLSWTERRQTIEVKDRGSIAGGHLRRGDDESVAISFTAKWTQLLGRAINVEDPLALYELLTFASGVDAVSTSPTGEQETLEFEFTVLDPAGEASERITFARVYRESLTMAEGNEYNTISFSGRDFETAPRIERVA